jgi:putative FmdB family regulatory protein
MPIYEYQSSQPHNACDRCRLGFEVFQGIHEEPIFVCPSCGNGVKKVISRCYAAVVEAPQHDQLVHKQVKEYERSGMWSHAAELADKTSEKTHDNNLKLRALDNYKKAGYDVDSLAKHVKKE